MRLGGEAAALRRGTERKPAPPGMLPLQSEERGTYTHGKGATEVVQDDIGTRVARVIHGGRGLCGLEDKEAEVGACAVGPSRETGRG